MKKMSGKRDWKGALKEGGRGGYRLNCKFTVCGTFYFNKL